jgi:hypothetical protein
MATPRVRGQLEKERVKREKQKEGGFDGLVTLRPELVVCTPSLQERLVDSASTSNNTNRRTSVTADGLLRSARKPNPRLIIFS